MSWYFIGCRSYRAIMNANSIIARPTKATIISTPLSRRLSLSVRPVLDRLSAITTRFRFSAYGANASAPKRCLRP